MSLLNVENIRKSYGKTEVLKDISFSLKKGEVLAIIGSSISAASSSAIGIFFKYPLYNNTFIGM